MPRRGNSKQRMQLQERINAFVKLGAFLKEIPQNQETFQLLAQKAQEHNGWFTEAAICQALDYWGSTLSEASLTQWTVRIASGGKSGAMVAVIMAGNIPLVGFHDFLSVLISGHRIVAKLSSNDTVLLPYLASKLIEIEPRFEPFIHFSEDKLPPFDAVIATGSNNTAMYFEHYFGKYPNIIRKNRNGIAVHNGKETPETLSELARDIFTYFGLGCRSVSKVYLPEAYDFKTFFEAMYSQREAIHHHKYINNYDYNKAVYLMSNVPLLDNEFMLLKEDQGLASPISVVYYEYYKSLEILQAKLEGMKDEIQCVVANSGLPNEIPFGKTQSPELWEYADGVDTLLFLANL